MATRLGSERPAALNQGAGLLLFLVASWLVGESALAQTEIIINAHEHIQSRKAVPDYLEAMGRNQIQKTILIGSPQATFDASIKVFDGEKENNEEIFLIAREHPKRFLVFPAINPEDLNLEETLKEYHQVGANGFKLYAGHKEFYRQSLDSSVFESIYTFCEEKNLPLIFHVNSGYFEEEFKRVLAKHPRLRILCPHFCLSSIRLDRFESLMESSPLLFTDLSFGEGKYLDAALERFSKMPERYRAIITRYQDRFLFGTDLVIRAGTVDNQSVAQKIMLYRQMLEQKELKHPRSGETLNGLHLQKAILEKIYYHNVRRFLGESYETI